MEFPYIAIPNDDVARPMLPVTLFGPDSTVDDLFLVDSGADITLIPAHLARELGIPFKKGRIDSFQVADGTFVQARMIELEILACGRRFQLPAACLETDRVSPLLGQQGFFDGFEITFRRFDGVFEVEHRSAASIG